MDKVLVRRAFESALEKHQPKFERFFLAGFFGLDISYGEDNCLIEFDAADFMFNPQGSVHGGVIAFVLDVSMGHLIHHATGRPGTTLAMTTNYLRPVMPGRSRCEGRYVKRGRAISSLESRLWNHEGKLSAVATSTWQTLQSDSA